MKILLIYSSLLGAIFFSGILLQNLIKNVVILIKEQNDSLFKEMIQESYLMNRWLLLITAMSWALYKMLLLLYI